MHKNNPLSSLTVETKPKKEKFSLLRKFAQYYQKRNPQKKAFIPYDRAKNILLFFEYDNTDELNAVKKIIAELQADNKNVAACGLSNTKNEKLEQSDFLKLYNKKSINLLFGIPKKKIRENIKAQQFDLLIDLSTQKQAFFPFLSLYTNAYTKVSTRSDSVFLFDFILKIKQEKKSEKSITKNHFLFNEIIFYLKRIQTTD